MSDCGVKVCMQTRVTRLQVCSSFQCCHKCIGTRHQAVWHLSSGRVQRLQSSELQHLDHSSAA